MVDDQTSEGGVIYVSVEDSPGSSFYYDVAAGTTCEACDASVDCTIKVSHQTFERLLQGTSTFEREVTSGSIVVSGDSQVLRHMGKLLRAQ